MSVFGVLSQRGHGHVVTTILIAMVAMLFTAISYGRMARAYPSAGSAFTYVGQEINPALGYVTGWSMVMDYMLNPMICIIWISQQAHVFAPGVRLSGPGPIFFAVVFTLLNIQGVKTSARVNAGLAAGMGVVIAVFFVAAARYIFGHPAGSRRSSPVPFTIRKPGIPKWCWAALRSRCLPTSASTAFRLFPRRRRIPRRNILLATVLTCVVIGFLSALEVYARPVGMAGSRSFLRTSTHAFTFVAGRPGSPLLAIVGFTLVVANFRFRHGSAAWRRPSALRHGTQQCAPEKVFRRGRSQTARARNNVVFVGALALAGAFLCRRAGATGYELGAELLNFGALIAFMGVNAAAFVRYFVREEKKKSVQFSAAGAGLFHLPGPVVEPEHQGENRRRDLDGRWHRFRRLEDARLPRRAGGLRTASGRMTEKLQ